MGELAAAHLGEPLGSDGNLYGTDAPAGNGYGTVFSYTGITIYSDDLNYFNVLHNFAVPTAGDNQDGVVPRGNLLEDGNGNLYGAATAGGPKGKGTIFVIGGAVGTVSSFLFVNASAPYQYNVGYPVNENAGSVTAYIDRSGSNRNAVSIVCSTADGSARAGTDYTATSQTLSPGPPATFRTKRLPFPSGISASRTAARAIST